MSLFFTHIFFLPFANTFLSNRLNTSYNSTERRRLRRDHVLSLVLTHGRETDGGRGEGALPAVDGREGVS